MTHQAPDQSQKRRGQPQKWIVSSSQLVSEKVVELREVEIKKSANLDALAIMFASCQSSWTGEKTG